MKLNLHKTLTWLAGLFMLATASSAQAGVVFDFNDGDELGVAKEGVTITATNFTAWTGLGIYATESNATLTITAEEEITSVEFENIHYIFGPINAGTVTTGNGSLNFSESYAKLTTAAGCKSVTITTASNTNFCTITVNLAGEAPTPAVKASVVGELDSKFYGTYYADYAWNIPAGYKAYYVSSVAEGEAVLSEITEAAVAAEVGVLLEGDAAAEELDIEKAESGFAPSVNYLEGQLHDGVRVHSDEPMQYYILSYNKNHENLAFYYQYTDGSVITSAKAYKAYLAVPNTNSSNALTLRFEDATGIKSISTDADSNILYNLQGQRVNGAQQGVFVKNGKKIVVK